MTSRNGGCLSIKADSVVQVQVAEKELKQEAEIGHGIR
ncbi:hypothetical protein PLANPX_5490 [Lacipirellula parvula]|uniref:Uncharacterized protein n=1 Tax=Lacipirellula parvula TaxID=2650471 RepID=A0A5K7XHF8_9BACT|nr:hypothetical protein PLANPX_5490 [Lacipirellula parvula]